MNLKRSDEKKESAKPRRQLSVESLEKKDLLTTAGIDVVSVGGGPDIQVDIIGNGGKDKLSAWSIGIGSNDQGNVLVLAEIDEDANGNFGDPSDFMLARVFNVPTMQANAASLGGEFLGFNFEGRGGNDEIILTGLKNLENTRLDGGDGDDTLIGGTKSRDAYHGGGGNDVVKDVDALDIPNTISGGDGDKDRLTFFGPHGVTYTNVDFEFITGTDHNDTIDSSGSGLKVEVIGGDGNDTLTGSPDNDKLFGGRGEDVLNGLAGNDELFGEAGKDTLNGGEGNDTIDGGDEDDVANGGEGTDTIRGGAGNDALNGDEGNDKLFGGTGDDTLTGGDGEDALDGEEGSDTANYSTSPAAVDIRLNEAKAENDGFGNKDSFVSIENATGSEFDDTLTGSDGNNVIKGLGGADTIIGNDGDDTIEGGDGDDDIVGDKLRTFQAGNDTINGGGGNDSIIGWNGNDVLDGDAGDDTIWGGFGDDALLGGGGADILNGGAGVDYIEGGFNEAATDKLFFEYDKANDRINDVAVVGGFANRDEFIALVELDTKLVEEGDDAGLPENPTYGSHIEGEGELTLFERLDIRDELKNEPFFSDATSNLIFTDYDGGDGANGDVLSFLDDIL